MAGYHHVNSYYRKDGTYVRGHTRRNPSSGIGIGGIIVILLILAALVSQSHGHAQTGRVQPSVSSTAHHPGTH